MRTTRTISNVSYNTKEFFSAKIDELVSKGVIDWCYWIYHTAEEDELKDHIHFILKPSKQLDTADLRKFFFEYDPSNPKPRAPTCKFELTNNMDDWLLYSVHDAPYLKSKGQFRKYEYKFSDIQATDRDALLQDWHKINRAKFELLDYLEDAVKTHTPFFSLVQSGMVPISQRAQYEFQYNALWEAFYNAENGTTGRKKEHTED